MTGATVGIVGAGAVGQTVAALLTVEPWCDRLLITSRTPERAGGLAADLDDMAHVAGTRTRAHVAATVAELTQADALVICPRATFTNTARRNVRMAGLAANAPLIADLAHTLTDYTGPVVMVTNPVDVLARLFATISGAPVYGVGSATDTARYRAALAAHHRVPVEAVDGYVIGEHGDGAVICASTTTINGAPCTVPLDPHPRPARRAAPPDQCRHRPHPSRTGRHRPLRAAQAPRARGRDRCAVRQPRGCVARNPVAHPCRSADRSRPGVGRARDRGPAHGPHQARSRLPHHQPPRTLTRSPHVPLTATLIHADSAAVTVASQTETVTDWSARYFGPWWNATPTTAPVPGGIADDGGLVLADVDPARVDDIRALVTDYGHDETTYAGARTLVARHDGITYAVQPGERIGYQADGRRLVIVGDEPEPVAVAAARLARELVRCQLLSDGWTVLHASAATQNGDAVLTLGSKGAGKTTTALLLARAGWGLLANDRVFARPEPDGRVRVLPWPSAAAIGLGLLDATGLYDPTRERVLAGGQLHPTQHRTVTQALTEGRREPLWREDGKELKPQFFPDQLSTWLGLTLATEATAAGLLFPTMSPEATPALVEDDRALTEADVFTAKTEDRYPDIFGLTPTTTTGAEALTEHLARLPRRSLVLSHDTDANAALLAKTAEEITAAR